MSPIDTSIGRTLPVRPSPSFARLVSLAAPLLLAGALALLSGCASGPDEYASPGGRPSAAAAENTILALSNALSGDDVRALRGLAPDGLRWSREALLRARSAAAAGKSVAASQEARSGLKRLARARSDAKLSRNMLSPALEARNRAHLAGARDYNSIIMNSLDSEIVNLARMVERGMTYEVKPKVRSLAQRYASQELVALKGDLSVLPDQALAAAKQSQSERLAPKTLARAEAARQAALAALDDNREERATADGFAGRSTWEARRAVHLSDTLREFKRLNYTREDILLWYQDQLSTIAQPLGEDLPFDTSNEEVVASLAGRIQALLDDAHNGDGARGDARRLKADLAEQEAEALRLSDELETLRNQYNALLADEQARFAFVQALFTPSEAIVYRQRNNVLISAQGFIFPPGNAEITAPNFPLLNKLVDAIKRFPDSQIKLSGHTDSRGDKKINLKLSKKRAEVVRRFLVDLGHIDPSRVVAEGHGERRPVASNDTREGRAANRRVEVLIINE